MLIRAVVTLGLLGLLVPAEADACGFKTFGMNATMSYSGASDADAVGTVAIYGSTRVNRRLLLGLRAAGHKVMRVASIDRARSADVVLVSTGSLQEVEEGIQGSSARVVAVMAAGETTNRRLEFAVRTNQRSIRQLALVERAIRAAKGRV